MLEQIKFLIVPRINKQIQVLTILKTCILLTKKNLKDLDSISPTYIKKILTSPKEEIKILIKNCNIPVSHTKWNSEFFNIDGKNVHVLVFNLTYEIYIRRPKCIIVHRILDTKCFYFQNKNCCQLSMYIL